MADDISRTAFLHASGIASPAPKPLPRSEPPPSISGSWAAYAFLGVPPLLQPLLSVATELTTIVGVPPVGADREEAGQRRDLVWLLDLSGQCQVTPFKWHPELVLREPDIQDEVELRFVQTFSAGLFEVGERFDESGGKRDWLDTPYGPNYSKGLNLLYRSRIIALYISHLLINPRPP